MPVNSSGIVFPSSEYVITIAGFGEKVCPDCNGSKTYVGLLKIEPCKKCNGTGKTQ